MHHRRIFFSNALENRQILAIVGKAHIRKTHASLFLRPNQRILPGEIDVVLDQHKISRVKLQIDPARRIRHDERLHAKRVKNVHRPHHIFHTAAFVKMQTPLQRKRRHPSDRAVVKTADMPRRRRFRHVRNVVKRDRFFNLHHLIDRIVQTRTEDHRDLRPILPFHNIHHHSLLYDFLQKNRGRHTSENTFVRQPLSFISSNACVQRTRCPAPPARSQRADWLRSAGPSCSCC